MPGLRCSQLYHLALGALAGSFFHGDDRANASTFVLYCGLPFPMLLPGGVLEESTREDLCRRPLASSPPPELQIFLVLLLEYATS